jgi:WD40 repeat protein
MADPIISLGFTPDGKRLRLVVPAKEDPKALESYRKLILEVRAGTAKPSLQGLVNSLAFRCVPADGQRPAQAEKFDLEQLPSPLSIMGSMKEKGAVGLMMTGRIPLKGQLVMPMCLALSPDRKTLAIGGVSTPVRVLEPGKDQEAVVLFWDLIAGEVRATLHARDGLILAMAFSPDGRTLASTGADKTIRLWDVAAARQKTVLSDQAAAGMSLAFSADGKVLASGSGDGTVKLWDVGTGQIRTSFIGHLNPVSSVTLTPDGRTLASGSMDGTIKVWDVASSRGLIRQRLDSRILALTILPDGQTVATVDQDGTIHFRDPATGQVRRAIRQQKALLLPFRSAIAPDGETAAVADLQTVSVVETASGKERHRLQTPNGIAYALAFSPDGKILAVGSISGLKSGEVVLWDVAAGKQRAVLKGHSDHVMALAFSPDGRTLVSGSQDQTVKIWDVAAGKELRTIAGHGAGVSALAFSRDGTKLAIASGPTLSIRDAATDRELRSLAIYSHHVVGMAFSPDGTRLATAGGEDEGSSKGGGTKLWDLASGQEVLSLGGSTDVITHIAFSPDGGRLLAARGLGGFLFGVAGGTSSGELVIWTASGPDSAAKLPSPR